MSDALTSIKRSLQGMSNKDMTLPISCEVVSVEGLTCTVKIAGGMEIPDVRLRASTTAGSSELLVTPKVKSKALIWSVSGTLDDTVLLKCDQIETISYKENGFEFTIDSTTKKIDIKNDQTSLKQLMQSVHDLIQNIKVTTPSGPSTGVLPDTTAALLQFSTKFKSLLK